ncbi:MAG: glutamate--tRNA ligase [Neisseriaceae bacterium]
MTIRTRFSPSPTGFLHVGGARTALFSWAYAKKMGGQFILRIEDTDLERSTAASVQAILDGMSWLGLDYDEGPFYQTQRLERYQAVIHQLIADGKAYYCYCSKAELEAMRLQAEQAKEHFVYDRRWRPEVGKNLPPPPPGISPVVRFKNPLTGSIKWNDLVKGEIQFEQAVFEDFIIARSDGMPTYNFCVVVDDYDMKISHVIRGDDHINNTPKQLNLFYALNAIPPQYAHLPMILNASGSKMSKRKDAVSVTEYEHMGILPQALLNHLARLGWSHQNAEFFSMEQFLTWFKLEDIQPSPSRFDSEKLHWLNGEYIRHMSGEELTQQIVKKLPQPIQNKVTSVKLAAILDLVKNRNNNLNDLAKEASYFYLKQTPTPEEIKKFWDESSTTRLEQFAVTLEAVPIEDWNVQTLHGLLKSFCEKQNIKMRQLGMPLRLKICGTSQTPSIDAVLAIMGKEEVLNRIRASCCTQPRDLN